MQPRFQHLKFLKILPKAARTLRNLRRWIRLWWRMLHHQSPFMRPWKTHTCWGKDQIPAANWDNLSPTSIWTFILSSGFIFTIAVAQNHQLLPNCSNKSQRHDWVPFDWWQKLHQLISISHPSIWYPFMMFQSQFGCPLFASTVLSIEQRPTPLWHSIILLFE